MSNESFQVSPQQELLWTAEPYGPTGRVQVVAGLDGPLDPDRFERALQSTVQRHEILRTTFDRQPGIRVPAQVIHDELRPTFSTLDLTGAEDQAARLQDACRVALAEPVDFANGPLLRTLLVSTAADAHTLVLTLPALCADAGSARSLLAELLHHYSGTGQLVEEPLQYADYAAWQRELPATAEAEAREAAEFWAGLDGATTPSFPFTKPGTGSFSPEEVNVEIEPALREAIEAAAAQGQVGVPAFVQAAWHVLLSRATAAEDVFVGVTGPLALHADLAGALGQFGRVLPIGAPVAGQMSFTDVIRAVRQAREDAARWEDHAPAALAAGLSVGFVAAEGFSGSSPDLSAMVQRVLVSGPQFRLWLTCLSGEGTLSLRLGFDPAAFGSEAVTELARGLQRALGVLAREPGISVGELDLLDPLERERLLVAFNDTAASIPSARLHELIAGRASASPGRLAVVDERGSLSYGELDARANQLANRLRSAGVDTGVTVGFCTDRSVELVIGMLGILKAGGAYVPLHYEHPPARLADQLASSGAKAIVTQQPLLGQFPEFAGEIVCLDRDRARLDAEPTTAPEAVISVDDLAYVIFTSGSTGIPKGVGVTHGNVVNYAAHITRELGADSEPLAFGLVTSISTDLGNTSVYGALCSGGTLVLLSPAVAADGAALARQLEQTPIDVLKITPSHLGALLSGGQALVLPRRWLVIGGERAPWDLIDRVRALSDVPILNHYGPTEATIGCCTFPVGDGPGRYEPATVPIGRPIANTACYVLDERMAPVPLGVPGRLFVAGAGVAWGYVGQPDLSAERFVRNEFAPALASSAPRMYDTGDLVRWLPDGNLEFLGRSDEQVKVRGYRVEPAEIEAALRTHPQVRDAVLTTPVGATGEVKLVAYCAVDGTPSQDELRAHLAQRLPEFMIPAVIATLDELPRTPSGKVDKLSLPDPDTLGETTRAYVAPRTPVEQAVAAVWAQVLGIERVGATDDFFELGGHSLLATHTVAQLCSELAVDLPLHALFLSPTVETLSAEITELIELDEEQDTETSALSVDSDGRPRAGEGSAPNVH